MPKISILIFLLQLLIGTVREGYLNLINIGNVLTYLLLLSSLLSLIIGAIVGLSQIRVKRLLAYSTINHVGFLLLALAVFSNSSIESFIFYIIQYTITNLNMFLIILALSYIINKSIDKSYLPHPNQLLGLRNTAYKNFKSPINNKTIIPQGVLSTAPCLEKDSDKTFLGSMECEYQKR